MIEIMVNFRESAKTAPEDYFCKNIAEFLILIDVHPNITEWTSIYAVLLHRSKYFKMGPALGRVNCLELQYHLIRLLS